MDILRSTPLRSICLTVDTGVRYFPLLGAWMQDATPKDHQNRLDSSFARLGLSNCSQTFLGENDGPESDRRDGGQRTEGRPREPARGWARDEEFTLPAPGDLCPTIA
jgi:hypothetical protein